MGRGFVFAALTALALGSVVSGAAEAKTASWEIDPAHSRVGFSVKHLGISRVVGQFSRFGGEIRADPETGRLRRVSAWVGVDSVDTGMEKRDQHLMADDFFAAARHPKMKLVAERIDWKGDRFTGVAKLTIRGVTRQVPFEGEILGVQRASFGGTEQLRAGYSASAEIDRKAFGLSFDKLSEGVALVGDDVRIQLEIQVAREI